MLTIISSSVKKNVFKQHVHFKKINNNKNVIITTRRTMATMKKWRDYIKENPYSYERGGEGYKKIEEIINNLSHSELQIFVNLSGAAKSFGSLSKEAWSVEHLGFNIAREVVGRRLGVSMEEAPGPRSNSGEGGQLMDDPNSKASIVQVASGRWMGDSPLKYLADAEEIDIKIAQGVKPGDGGHLPGTKATPLIARVRGARPGRDLYSPPPHHDIYSVEDLAQLIHDLRQVNPQVRKIWVKLASRSGVGPISLVVAKAGAGVEVTGFGGTGAAKAESKHFYVRDNTPGILEVRNSLISEGLWPIDLAASGRIQTAEDIARVVFMGANRINMGTPLMLANGCVKADSCQNDDCPVGIATQQEHLIEKFPGRPENAIRFLSFLSKQTQRIFDQYGLDFHSARGRADLLQVEMNESIRTGLPEFLKLPEPPAWAASLSKTQRVPHDLFDKTTEQKLIANIALLPDSLNEKIVLNESITNKHRTFGALLSNHIVRNKDFEEKINKNGLRINCDGVGGLSFGTGLPNNVELVVDGPVNHGVGKALSGGTIIAQVMGDQAGYGAGNGTLITRSIGDRAAIRSYELDVLVETTGDMSSCYRTGGHFFVLGHPSHYNSSSTFKVGNYKSMDLWSNNHAMGPGIGGGMGGGVIVLPRQLHEENVSNMRYAPSLQNVLPRDMKPEETQLLVNLLTQANGALKDCQLMEALLNEGETFLNKHMVVLDPVAAQPIAKGKHLPNVTWKKHESDNSVLAIDWEKGNERSMSALNIAQSKGFFDVFQELSGTSLKREESSACGVHFLGAKQGSSKEVVDRLLHSLHLMAHRAGYADPKSCDGAGINLKIDAEFWKNKFPNFKDVFEDNNYAIVASFIPEEAKAGEKYIARFEKHLINEGLTLSAKREVPMNREHFGVVATTQQLPIMQFLVLRPTDMPSAKFEAALLRFQTRMDYETLKSTWDLEKKPSIISAEPDGNVIYKGLMAPSDLANAFPDLKDPLCKASRGLVHDRFCTNAPKGLDKIQPLSIIANNGEMNSLSSLYQFMTNDSSFLDFLGLEESAKLWDETLEGEVPLSDSYMLSVYLRYLLATQPEKSFVDHIASLIPNVVNKQEDPERYLSTFLAAVNYVGPLAGVFSWSGKVVVGVDPNGFRPLCATEFTNEEGTEFLQFSSEWITDIDGAKYSVVHPGQVLELDATNGNIIPANMGEPWNEHPANSNSKGTKKKKSEGTFGIYFYPPKSKNDVSPIQDLNTEILHALKPMVGWNQDNDKYVKDLCRGKLSIESMGHAGPTASEVRGNVAPNSFDLLNHSFAQVSNPPLAWREEGDYMSLDTRVGPYLLPSPFLSNTMINSLQEKLESKVVSTTFPVNTMAPGMRVCLQRIVNDVVEAVEEGKRFIVLSELDISPSNGPCPLNLVVGSVHQSLLKLGLRKDVHLCVQSISALRPGHFSQLLAMGADTIHPVLLLDPRVNASLEETNTDEDSVNISMEEHSANVLSGCDEGLKHYMSTVGLGTISSYRGGSHIWQAETLNTEVADLMGLQPPRFSGIGFGRLAKWLYTTWFFPSKEGPGLYQYNGQRATVPVWSAEYTRAVRRMAADEKEDETMIQDMEVACDNVNVIKRSAWSMSRIPSKMWGPENPMNICVVGGGAAGYFVTNELLEADIPANVTMVEKNLINGGGVVYRGLSPLHHSTKRNTLKRLLNIHKSGIEKGALSYAGGVQINKGDLKKLLSTFSVVIDASGSSTANHLSCPGHQHATEAAEIYSRYNQIMDPTSIKSSVDSHWHGSLNRFNRATVVVGGGNVAFDILSVLTLSKHLFEPHTINQKFIEARDEYGSTHVVSLIRKQPWDLASDVHVLKEFFSLMQKSNVKIQVSGVSKLEPTDDMTEQERAKLELFLEYVDKEDKLNEEFWPEARDGRSVHFRFGQEVSNIERLKGGLKVTIGQNGQYVKEFQAYQVIEAMGYVGEDKFEIFGENNAALESLSAEEKKQIYQAGWAFKPGNLASAEGSAKKIVGEITRNYHMGVFHGLGKSSIQGAQIEPLLASAPVDTSTQENIFNYLLEVGRIEEAEDYFNARSFVSMEMAANFERSLSNIHTPPAVDSVDDVLVGAVSNVRDGFFGFTDDGGDFIEYAANDARLDEVIGCTGSCDGAKTCLDCVVDVIGKEVDADASETRLLAQIGMFKPNRILSCCHTAKEVEKSTVKSVEA